MHGNELTKPCESCLQLRVRCTSEPGWGQGARCRLLNQPCTYRQTGRKKKQNAAAPQLVSTLSGSGVLSHDHRRPLGLQPRRQEDAWEAPTIVPQATLVDAVEFI